MHVRRNDRIRLGAPSLAESARRAAAPILSSPRPSSRDPDPSPEARSRLMLSRRDFAKASLRGASLIAMAPAVPGFLAATARAAATGPPAAVPAPEGSMSECRMSGRARGPTPRRSRRAAGGCPAARGSWVRSRKGLRMILSGGSTRDAVNLSAIVDRKECGRASPRCWLPRAK